MERSAETGKIAGAGRLDQAHLDRSAGGAQAVDRRFSIGEHPAYPTGYGCEACS